jgi:hypothetical protein
MIAGTLNLGFQIANSKDYGLNTGGNATKDLLNFLLATQFTDGTGANQANSAYHDRGTLVGGGDAQYDFRGSTIRDAFGTLINWQAIKAVCIVNDATTVGHTLTISSNLVDVDAQSLILQPGGVLLLMQPSAAGMAVTAGFDIITIANPGSSGVSYRIAALGITV